MLTLYTSNRGQPCFSEPRNFSSLPTHPMKASGGSATALAQALAQASSSGGSASAQAAAQVS